MSRAACIVAFALAMAGACGSRESEPQRTGGDERPAQAEPAPAEPVEPEEAEPVLAPLDPQSACGRAQECCRAFVAATPNARLGGACAGPAESDEQDDDEACERMRQGWGEALALREDVEAPEACLNE